MVLKRYRQLALITTIGICILVVAGGVVRLTGSGLGCDDWPNCNDERFIDVSTGHAAIEQINRLLSGVIGLPTLLLAITAVRVAPSGNGLRWPAVGVLLTVFANGVVGGFAVRGDLHPALVQSHFLLAMASIAFGLIAIRRSNGPISWSNAAFADATQRLVVGVIIASAAALVTGTIVTGTGPHAGEEDVRRFGFDISNVARTHSVTVIVALALAVLLAWSLRAAANSKVQSAMSTWLFVAVMQGALGYAQYFTGVPELLVGVHIAGATALWVVTVRLGLAALDDTHRDEVATSPETLNSGFGHSAERVV